MSTKVFISYSSADKPFVDRLVDDLVKHRLGIWYDTWEIRVGDSLTQKIQEGIRESSFLAVVLTPNSVNSRWVQEELRAALAEEMRRGGKFVLPILHQQCEIPPFLSDRVYADFRADYARGFERLLLAVASSTGPTEHTLLDRITDALILDRIDQMTVAELARFVKQFEERFDVKAEVPSRTAGQENPPA